MYIVEIILSTPIIIIILLPTDNFVDKTVTQNNIRVY